jgi:ribose transport system permease protein
VNKTVLRPVRFASVASLLNAGALQTLLAFAALLLMVLFFSFTPWGAPYFFTFSNFTNILVATAVAGVLGLGETFVIVTGGIDLSVGTNMTLAGVMTGVVMVNWNLPVPVGVAAGILTGGFIGFVNGFLVARLKLPPFIATLGMLNVCRGLALVISDLHPIYFSNSTSLHDTVMGSFIGQIIPGLTIPNIALILFAAAILAGFILSKTALGRFTYALGSNEEAVRLSGVNVEFWKIGVYTVCGLFAGLAGVIISARVGSAQPGTGFGYELDAITAVVIGGTSLAGGEGTILGTVIGAFIVKTLADGLQLKSISQEWQLVAAGVVVIVAVYLDILRRRDRT